jgi:UDP-glucose 4-epimerase
MRVLVTGGAGFIGSNLVEALAARGHSVRILDNFSTGRHSNLTLCRDDVEVLEADVRDHDAVARAVEGCEVVFHLAAVNSVRRSLEAPRKTLETNVRGTLEVVRAARRAGVRRLLYASSSSVYGANPESPRHEGSDLLPLSPYAFSKLAGERICASAGAEPETVILRYFNVYGPRQEGESRYAAVVPRFLKAARERTEAVVYGSGRQSRDFTFVDDIVQANLLAMNVHGAHGTRCNIATGRATTINRLVEIVSDATGVDLAMHHEAPRGGDTAHSVADIAAARGVLGYEPATKLAEGIRRTALLDAEVGAARG